MSGVTARVLVDFSGEASVREQWQLPQAGQSARGRVTFPRKGGLFKLGFFNLVIFKGETCQKSSGFHHLGKDSNEEEKAAREV